MSYPEHSLWGTYPSAEMQSVYSSAPADQFYVYFNCIIYIQLYKENIKHASGSTQVFQQDSLVNGCYRSWWTDIFIKLLLYQYYCKRDKKNTLGNELLSKVLIWTPTCRHTSVNWMAKTYIHRIYAYTRNHLEALPNVIADLDGWKRNRHRVECSPMVRETGVQSQVELYQRLKNGTWCCLA